MLPPEPPSDGPVTPTPPKPSGARSWRKLAADSDREVVQEQIRNAIRSGEIRVRPWPGDPERVQIIPVTAG